MAGLRNKLKKIPILKFLSSLEIAVLCLSLLFILTLWGTIAQVSDGLYLTQEKYFNSFFFLAFGFIPFPGAQLVLWVFFINVCCSCLMRLVYRWSRVGIVIIHAGLILFCVSAFVTYHCAEESNITLKEGQASNVSSAYHDWEVSLWRNEGESERKKVIAYDAKNLKSGDVLDFSEIKASLIVDAYYPNSIAHASSPGAEEGHFRNASGIHSLRPLNTEKEPVRNLPGGLFHLKVSTDKGADILLYGGEINPTPVEIHGQKYYLMLRRKRYVLPFTLRLDDFIMETHPGTTMARSFKSQVAIKSSNVWRDILISMNKPLRYNNYALYQSSYQISETGEEYSTLAVVKNAGRLLPYIATFVTFGGLMIHFCMMAFANMTGKKG